MIASARLTRWSAGAARVLAFNAWQDPGEAGDFSQDATTAALLSLLECDKHKDVRRAVLASVGVSAVTVPALVERTRDNAEEVRRTAFQTVAAKVPLGDLSIAARATLLRRGLGDRAPSVRAAAVSMLGMWLKGALLLACCSRCCACLTQSLLTATAAACGDDVVRLLGVLDVETHGVPCGAWLSVARLRLLTQLRRRRLLKCCSASSSTAARSNPSTLPPTAAPPVRLACSVDACELHV